MKSGLAWLAGLVLLLTAGVLVPAPARANTDEATPAGRYVVRVEGDGFAALGVSAHFARTSGRIFPGIGGGDYLDGGWPSVIENLTVSTPDGRPVSLEPAIDPDYGAPFWALSVDGAAYDGPVDLSYRVNLDYGRSRHPYGNEQGGQVFADSVYTVARPVFVASDIDGSWQVRFDLPEGMQVAYPVPPVDGASTTFLAGDFLQLQDNPITLGRFYTANLPIGDATLELVLPDTGEAGPAAVEATALAIMTLYGRLLPDAGARDYQLVMFPSWADDGESYTNAAVVTTSQDFTPRNQLVWSGLMAHEIFHYWNGVRLVSASPEATQWFSEGFTEYYAVLAQANLGLIDADLFARRLAANAANYLYFLQAPAYDGLTLETSGHDKSRNRQGVYNGGFIIALALDLDIRVRTGGERSLDDVMRALFNDYAETGTHYTQADIAGAAMAVTGHDYSGFFRDHVEGRVPVDVTALFASLGFDASSLGFAGELYLTPQSAAATASRETWHWLAHEHFDRVGGVDTGGRFRR